MLLHVKYETPFLSRLALNLKLYLTARRQTTSQVHVQLMILRYQLEVSSGNLLKWLRKELQKGNLWRIWSDQYTLLYRCRSTCWSSTQLQFQEMAHKRITHWPVPSHFNLYCIYCFVAQKVRKSGISAVSTIDFQIIHYNTARSTELGQWS